MDKQNEVDPVDTVVREGNAFLDRHWPGVRNTFGKKPDNVPAVAGIAALAWGMMRAIYECPNCPGCYRVPVGERMVEMSASGNLFVGDKQAVNLECNSNEDVLVCPNCNANFVHSDAHPSIKKLYEGEGESDVPNKTKRRRNRK